MPPVGANKARYWAADEIISGGEMRFLGLPVGSSQQIKLRFIECAPRDASLEQYQSRPSFPAGGKGCNSGATCRAQKRGDHYLICKCMTWRKKLMLKILPLALDITHKTFYMRFSL